jgi:hypothetical protein
VGKILNPAGVATFLRGPRGWIGGLLVGIGLALTLRAAAQQPPPPAPPAPAARYQISVADPQKIYVLDHHDNMIYLFSTNNQGVWEATEGFAVTPEIDRLHRSTPIPKVNPQ